MIWVYNEFIGVLKAQGKEPDERNGVILVVVSIKESHKIV